MGEQAREQFTEEIKRLHLAVQKKDGDVMRATMEKQDKEQAWLQEVEARKLQALRQQMLEERLTETAQKLAEETSTRLRLEAAAQQK